MRKYRSVDDAGKWMKTAIRDDTIVPALASAVIAEIQAQSDHISSLDIEISQLGVVIRGLEKDLSQVRTELELIYCILSEQGLKDKVVGILQKNGVVPTG